MPTLPSVPSMDSFPLPYNGDLYLISQEIESQRGKDHCLKSAQLRLYPDYLTSAEIHGPFTMLWHLLEKS